MERQQCRDLLEGIGHVNHQSTLLRSADFQEGVTALMEKRDPVWKRK